MCWKLPLFVHLHSWHFIFFLFWIFEELHWNFWEDSFFVLDTTRIPFLRLIKTEQKKLNKSDKSKSSIDFVFGNYSDSNWNWKLICNKCTGAWINWTNWTMFTQFKDLERNCFFFAFLQLFPFECIT